MVGENFMSELDLKQPRFAYSACQPFTKKKEKGYKSIKAFDKAFNIANNLQYDEYQRGSTWSCGYAINKYV